MNRAVVALALVGVALLVSGVLVAAGAVGVGLAEGWTDRVCRETGTRGCGPAWLVLAVGVVAAAGGIAFGVSAIGERSGRE